ncbi:MAG: hypothetical protein KAG61_02800 [Bacteriovoracaceae bacterium]|nr:hypothetical protein [Bacteriovoracaceae bacterium]
MKKLITLTILSTLLSLSAVQAKASAPAWASGGPDRYKEIIQPQVRRKSAKLIALEEYSLNPSLKKANDPIWASDGSKSDLEEVEKR